jgi:hypothetical protein
MPSFGGPRPTRVRTIPSMTSNDPQPRPAEFKTKADGRGGLIKVTFVGEPHEGRELYIDELDLPPEIWTTPAGVRFEWWGPAVKADMDRTAVGSNPDAPPLHYALRIPDDTREPLFVSDDQVR